MSPLEIAEQRFKNKKILIIGLGLQGGVGDAKFFAKLGSKVRITDLKSEFELMSPLSDLKSYSLEYNLGKHDLSDIDWADYILRNPGVPHYDPMIQKARELGKPILMRTALFLELAKIYTIGITGSRGKSTTTAMLYQVLKRNLPQTILKGGNESGINDLELLGKITDPKNTIALLELSSWQLSGFHDLKQSVNLAIYTNLYPEHLNKYQSLDEYYFDKKALALYQTPQDSVILNHKINEFNDWSSEFKGKISFYSSTINTLLSLKIKGEHNRENAAAVIAAANILNITEADAINSLNEFDGVPFRQQLVGQKNGLSFINDTTATSPEATLAALNTFSNVILLAGGSDKKLPFAKLYQAIKLAKQTILFQGEGTNRLIAEYPDLQHLPIAKSMKAALSLATSKAMSGDNIILSPGCASFGMFKNEFDRGEQYNSCVQDYLNQN